MAEIGSGKLHRICVQDVFGESGTPEELYEAYEFTPAHLAKKIQRFVRD